MDRFIENITATCDYIQAKKRSKKKINISFDEWNVWFHAFPENEKAVKWQEGPSFNEDIYTFEDAPVSYTHLQGVCIIEGTTADGKAFRAIPYYLWNNRGKGKMNVWVRRPEEGGKENGTPEGRPEEAAGFAAHGAGTNAAGVDLTGWEGKLYRRYR